ncbi:hypothetical protein [Nocardioides sp. Soil805]|uniref:hypothetical protein n=1 Tax=Nocardioides sp. Soil805 TaxID=1736416 RepID=UPI0007024FA6|nr:hypothetical protein [Nocardioides sp. Soil805]KRF36526.1 hypothetical protein ASG94_03500 [Nocardioides sp. Soil805]
MSSHSGPRSAPGLRPLLGWSVALVAGGVAYVAADTASPLALVVLAVATRVHAHRLGWRLGLGVVTLGALVAQVLLAWAAPHVGGSFSTDMLVCWLLAGAGYAAVASVLPPARLGAPRWWDLAACLVTPALVAAYIGWTVAVKPRPWLAWAMGGDAANNMILNREFLLQGGLLRSQGNGAPLATVIHGSWAAPAVLGHDNADQVRSLVLLGGQLGLLTCAALGVVGSLLALRNARPARGHRILVGAAAGLVPWLWCVAGFVFLYGYQNAAPAMLVLLLGWLCWLAQRDHPVGAVTGLVLATWASAIVWGPVTVVPAGWLVVAVLRQRRALRGAGRLLLVPATALAGAIAYALLVTLPDLRAQGGLPAFDGAHPNFDQHWSLRLLVTLAVVVALLHRRLPSEVRWGFWAAVPGIALGVLQLIRARDGLPEAWGYYPIKFAWIVSIVLALVLFAELVGPLQRLAGRAWGGAGVLTAIAVPVVALFLVTPPVRPVTAHSFLAPVQMHDDTSTDIALDRMFTLMEEHPRTILSSYWNSPSRVGFDSLSNFWLLQSGATGISDPIRFPAYSLDSTDPAALCEAVRTWGEDVRVVTRSPKLTRSLESCDAPGFEVEVVRE